MPCQGRLPYCPFPPRCTPSGLSSTHPDRRWSTWSSRFMTIVIFIRDHHPPDHHGGCQQYLYRTILCRRLPVGNMFEIIFGGRLGDFWGAFYNAPVDSGMLLCHRAWASNDSWGILATHCIVGLSLLCHSFTVMSQFLSYIIVSQLCHGQCQWINVKWGNGFLQRAQEESEQEHKIWKFRYYFQISIGN